MHAALGGIALITGFISMVAKKGKPIHKKSGLLFFYSMMLSGIIALVVAVLPKHESPFLFAVGIFSLYFVLTGKRALHFKLEKPDLRADKWISKIMILTGILMILLPIVLTKRIHIVLVVSAIIGIVFSVRDLKLFKNPEQLRKGWLKLHLGKMIGGYISATTAFVVVNEYFPSFYGWFIPGIIGGFIIAYWMRKLKKKQFLTPYKINCWILDEL
jgi:hypothetical protein